MTPLPADEFRLICEWYERHRRDYCQCVSSPPQVWTEYFARLLAAQGYIPKAAKGGPEGVRSERKNA